MSDKKRARLKRCQVCHQPAVVLVHDKCHGCRVELQLRRYSRKGKLGKFRSN